MQQNNDSITFKVPSNAPYRNHSDPLSYSLKRVTWCPSTSTPPILESYLKHSDSSRRAYRTKNETSQSESNNRSGSNSRTVTPSLTPTNFKQKICLKKSMAVNYGTIQTSVQSSRQHYQELLWKCKSECHSKGLESASEELDGLKFAIGDVDLKMELLQEIITKYSLTSK